jgi:CRP/FNR family transcriptional regulator
MDRGEALRRVLFLKGLPNDARAEVAAAGFERRLAAGELLFAEGDRAIGLLVVLTGAVRVYKVDSRGRSMTLFVDRPGSSVLDLPLFDGGNYPAHAEASEDSTSVLVVPRDRFQALLAAHPEIAAGAVRSLAVQTRKLIEMLKAQALDTVRARLAAYLLTTAGDERTFPLRETNEAIGGQVGTVREVISRTLNALEEARLIERRGRIVTLLDRNGLRRIAEREA